jgi:hypothetical protein
MQLRAVLWNAAHPREGHRQDHDRRGARAPAGVWGDVVPEASSVVRVIRPALGSLTENSKLGLIGSNGARPFDLAVATGTVRRVDGSGLTTFVLIGEPFGGAPQIVVTRLDELSRGLGVLRDRRHDEALLGKVAEIRGLEIGGVGITRNVVHDRCATHFGGPCVAGIV